MVDKGRDIVFEKLNFKEFINDDLFTVILSEEREEDEEHEGGMLDDPFGDKFHEQIYKIRENYIHMLYNGMKPYLFHTNFKITKHMFQYLEETEGLEFLRCITQHRGIVCFGKMFDPDEQKVKLKRSIDEYQDTLCQLKNLETLTNSTTTT